MTDGTPFEIQDDSAISSQGIDGAEVLFEDILKLIEKRATDQYGPGRTGRVHFTNQGQISDIVLPEGWKAVAQADNVQGNSVYNDYRPTSDSSVRISFFYRGRVTSRTAGARFHALLQEPNHILSSKEIESLKETLRDKGNNGFSVLSARTDDLNGKRVLIVEGRYDEIQQDNRSIYIDADGTTGRVVQEIYYQAPRDSYLRYLKQAKESMNSIRWR